MEAIAATMSTIRVVESTYKAIQRFKGLPKEFEEVNRVLTVAQDTLGLVDEQLKTLNPDESSKKALQSVVRHCEGKAKMLRDIFEKVDKGLKDEKFGSVLDSYRASLLRLGKAHRVEVLMQGILRGLDTLATNQMFKIATQNSIYRLEKAINQLSKVESSVPDSDLESAGTNILNNNSSGTANQYNLSGHNQTHFGSGEMWNVQNMNYNQCNEQNNETKMKILRTLHTSPYLDRRNRNPDRVLGTCEWFVSHPQFKHWREGKSSSLLWVSANPGCGKSVLAKYLTDEIKTTKFRTTCYFFFKEDFDDQKSARSALSCILHQLLTQRPDLFFDKVIKRLESCKVPPENSYYEFWELWNILVMASQNDNAGEIVCILDALDECEDKERVDLSKALRNFYGSENDAKNNALLKFLITGRPYEKIRWGLQLFEMPGLPVIHLRGEGDLEMSKITKEIDIYITYEVSRIRTSLRLNESEERILLQGLQGMPNETYLWVYLTLEWIECEINNKINKREIRKVISSLPRTVEEAYENILAKTRRPKEAKKLLHMIVAAARPLTLAEIDLALHIRQDHTSYEHLEQEQHLKEERVSSYLRDLCGLFVNVIESKVYLLHQTARDFLISGNGSGPQEDDSGPRDDRSRRNENQFTWRNSLRPSDSHRILCQICIWHLLFTKFETDSLPEDLAEHLGERVSGYLRDNVFLEYSARNWAAHFRESGIKDDRFLESLRRVCDANSRRCRTWFTVYWASKYGNPPPDFTTLMISSYFGLEEIAKIQLWKDDINAKDGIYGRSALSWASEKGFDRLVRLLIEGPSHSEAFIKLSAPKRADIDSTDRYGETPLTHAVSSGHEDIVKLLLDEGANIEGGNTNSYLPLFSAYRYEFEAIVKLILDKGANTEGGNTDGYTPLLLAVRRQEDAVVKLLLDMGANIEGGIFCGVTPLSLAVRRQNEAVVKLLLDKGANIEGGNVDGVTPLSLAVRRQNEAVVKLLLDKGANVEGGNVDGYKPLLLAVRRQNEAIVKLLLDKGADTEGVIADGHTSFLLWKHHISSSWAATNGHEDDLKMEDVHAD
ncbi:unnamed protein product [Clonostachys rosea]|uniref:NACHT-NTPase and P-loop NTPases N-terminal domain-containing protein n=1 Tax=Bionectria ochroleuca TaxID=29856 RepID=A0ABY6UPB3_BIOOC|nr:unnamed protein product [Clonostachys rosea]